MHGMVRNIENPGRSVEDDPLAEFSIAARRQVDAREPLDGTECSASESLADHLFVCANPVDHPGADAGWGHRFVHVTRDEDQ
jgi:hypothetical protein